MLSVTNWCVKTKQTTTTTATITLPYTLMRKTIAVHVRECILNVTKDMYFYLSAIKTIIIIIIIIIIFVINHCSFLCRPLQNNNVT